MDNQISSVGANGGEWCLYRGKNFGGDWYLRVPAGLYVPNLAKIDEDDWNDTVSSVVPGPCSAE
jgi:hypothetical protein